MANLSKEEIKYIKETISIKLGIRIREVRVEKGLTQVDLADKIQSDRQYMYKIENGKVGISISKLAIIAKALEVSLTNLVDID